MRPSVYPNRVSFHINDRLCASLHAKAEREGRTLAEVLRRAVEREAELEACQ
jgi:hypothetical protein